MTRAPYWKSLEKIHHVIYFAPQAEERFTAVGLDPGWMGYFASRSAALGTPSAEVVIATFHGFSPDLVRTAIPRAWQLASPETIIEARLQLGRDVIGPAVEAAGIDLGRAADAVQQALPTLDLTVRPLGAAHVGVPAPEDDLGRLWHGAAALREYRGDAHLAVLTTEGLGGVDANVLNVAAGLTFKSQQRMRGWTDEEWTGGQDRLRERGWLDVDGAITDEGSAARQKLEDATDDTVMAGVPDATHDLLLGVADDLRAVSDRLSRR